MISEVNGILSTRLFVRVWTCAVLSAVVTVFALTSTIGCAKKPTVDTAPPESEEVDSTKPPTSLASELAQAYANVDRYADTTVMRLTYHFDDGRKETTETTFRTRFQRPNKLDLQVASEDNKVIVVGDGQQLTARIMDGLTKDFDNQLVVQDTAADKLSVQQIYSVTELVDPIAPGEMISALVGAPAGLDLTPIGLLLSEGRLLEICNNKAKHVLFGIENLQAGEEVSCEIVEATEPEGKYRLWLTTNEQHLRRIEFPPVSENLPSGLKRMNLVVEISDVRFDQSHEFTPITEGQQVSHFVMPPLPPATNKLGRPIDELQFVDIDGRQVKINNTDNQIAVIVWFHDHPASRLVLEQVDQLRRQAPENRVRFHVVSVDAANAEVQKLLQSWNVHANCLTDPKAVGRDLLDVEEAPTTAVIGANNRLHYFEVGANPNIGTDLAVVLDRLLAGKDVAKETLSNIRSAKASYDQQLRLAKSGAGFVEATEKQDVPPASEPEKLSIKQLWTNDEVSDPGNMLLVPGKRKQIIVMAGWNQIAVLDIDGELNRRVKLELPADDGVSVLRAGKSEKDRALFAATTRGGRRAFVFDFAGKRIAQYPAKPSPSSSITDVVLADLNNDKRPELIVGWQGNVGIHGVDMQGRRQWTNRALSGVFAMSTVRDEATTRSEAPPLLASSESGAMFLIGAEGRTLREIRVDNQRFHEVSTWPGNAKGFDALLSVGQFPKAEDAAHHCGFSLSPTGELLVTGINRTWKSLWEYRLPTGVYRHQLDKSQSFKLSDIGPTWIFPGADGSVHLVSVDGKFNDHFFAGAHIRGLAGLNVGGRSILLLSTDSGVTAYEVSAPSSAL